MAQPIFLLLLLPYSCFGYTFNFFRKTSPYQSQEDSNIVLTSTDLYQEGREQGYFTYYGGGLKSTTPFVNCASGCTTYFWIHGHPDPWNDQTETFSLSKTQSKVTYFVKFITYEKNPIVIMTPEGDTTSSFSYQRQAWVFLGFSYQSPTIKVVFSSEYYSDYTKTITLSAPPASSQISSLHFVLGNIWDGQYDKGPYGMVSHAYIFNEYYDLSQISTGCLPPDYSVCDKFALYYPWFKVFEEFDLAFTTLPITSLSLLEASLTQQQNVSPQSSISPYRVGSMGVLIGPSKAITIHNFVLDRSWMLAAHFRFDCNAATFVSSPGDLFLQLSSDGVNDYAMKATPNVASKTVQIQTYDQTGSIYTSSLMTANSNTECPWFKAMVAARAYRVHTYINAGIQNSIISDYLSDLLYFSKATGPFYVGKDFQGFVRRVKISNAFGASTDHRQFLQGYLPDSPPLCTQYNTYSASCAVCDRACKFCVGASRTQCTGECTLTDPPTDPTTLYPFGTCPEWVCDGRCGSTQYSCEVPQDSTQCSGACGTGAIPAADNSGVWTCECDWDYQFSVANNICEPKPNPCDAACEPTQCTGPSSTDCSQCALNYFQLGDLSAGSGNCQSSCPTGHIANPFARKCLEGECDARCGSCFDYGKQKCDQCAAEADEVGSTANAKICECKWNYKYDPSINECALLENPCHSTCAFNSCTARDQVSCLNCAASHYKLPDGNGQYTCVSPCPAGYVTDLASLSCLSGVCDPRCVGCFQAQDNSQCITCIDGSSSSSCDCPPSQYFNATSELCQGRECVILDCYPGCLSCTSSAYNECLTCDTQRGYTFLDNRCPFGYCESGTFFKQEERQCRNCHERCLQCSGQLDTHCTLCSDEKLLINHECLYCSEIQGFLNNPDGSNNCLQICGDGLNVGILPCDDGNTQNHDGCSSECEVEIGFACQGGSPTSADVCVDILPPFIEEAAITSTNDRVTLFFSETVYFSSLQPHQAQLKLSIQGEAGSYNFEWQLEDQHFPANSISISLIPKATLFGTQSLVLQFSQSSHPPLVTDSADNRLSTSILTIPLNPFQYETLSEKAAVQSAGNSIRGVTMIAFVFNLLISQILKGSIEAMWNLMNILQLINLVPLLSLYFPPNLLRMFKLFAFANAQSDTLQSVFQTHIIDPDKLRQSSFSPTFEEQGYESNSILLNCGSQLFIVIIAIASYPLVLLLSKVEGCCFKCCSCVRNLEQSYRFNMFLRGIIENYVEILINVLLNMYNLHFDTSEETASSVCTLLVLFIWIAAPLFITSLLVTNSKSNMKSQSTLNIYGTIYEAFNLNNDCALLYYPLFLLRRALFAVILVMLVNYPYAQCGLCIGSSALVGCSSYSLSASALDYPHQAFLPQRTQYSGHHQ